MTINLSLETLIPVLAAAAGSLATILYNARIQMTKVKGESAKSGAEAGAITAKTEADIFQQKWDKIVTALERRVDAAEKAEEEARVALALLRAQLDECAQSLRKIGASDHVSAMHDARGESE